MSDSGYTGIRFRELSLIGRFQQVYVQADAMAMREVALRDEALARSPLQVRRRSWTQLRPSYGPVRDADRSREGEVMASVAPYRRGYSFAGWQANNPQKPLPRQKVDEDPGDLQRTTKETIDGLNQIKRTDGRLQNGIVTQDALAPELQTGVQPTVLCQPSTQYEEDATVSYGSRLYRSLQAHVSAADFADDLAAGNWLLFADFGTLLKDTNAARDEAVGAAAVSVQRLRRLPFRI